MRTPLACATSGSGDPKLTALGAEQPFGGRLCSALELSCRTDAIGEPSIDELALRELRADGTVAWAPIDRVFLLTTILLVAHEARKPSFRETQAWCLGDIELRARWLAYRDRDFAPR